MNSSFIRFQAYSSFTFTATVIILGVLAVMYHAYTPKLPPTIFELKSINPFVTKTKIDLSSMFVPGLKQIFLYAMFKNGDQEEMVWSKIITRSTSKVIDYNIPNKYGFEQSSVGELTLEGCMFPFVGLITTKVFGRTRLNK